MWMPLKERTQLAQRHHVFFIEVAGECQARIERWRFVSRRPDNPVTHLPVWVLRIVLSTAEIKRRCDIHDGERSARVAGTCGAKRGKAVAAHQGRSFLHFAE